MSDSVERLLKLLEPLIVDLDDKIRELESKKEKLEKVSRFVAYINDDVHRVGVYADQDFILGNLEIINSNREEYKAYCYLLKSDDENIKKLPQYEKATQYITNMINCFKTMKVSLTEEVRNLESDCKRKSVEKKYYDLFSKERFYVSEIDEYKEFLDEHEISVDDKIQLLLLTIKKNVEKYQEELRGIS